MLLRLRDIARFYGPRLIFSDISLDLSGGEILLLCGPNGAGKSTLLKIIAGLMRPASGKVLCDKELNIGMIGPQSCVYSELSASENLRFWADLHGCRFSDKDMQDMLERMRLAAFADEKAGTFSTGMLQRLNLARVFMLRPDLLLLDEPASGLDEPSLAVLWNETAAAAERGAGIVMITHHPREAPLSNCRVALLENRRLCVYDGIDAFPGRENGPPAAGTAAAAPAGGERRC
ncbi:MAG: ABC transporter ATP-binding protein [Desulfovibrio sp.]|jgi:heme exporter protein A|nr:ABC transporter ATP-binding protein [Desulfovibrio sp.]